MNKKGQMMPQDGQTGVFGNVNPVLIIGIAVFIIPFFGPVIHMNIPGWINVVGIALILIGAVLSIMKSSGIDL